jgi:hypothetical protein
MLITEPNDFVAEVPDADMPPASHHHDRIIVPRRALHAELAAVDGSAALCPRPMWA